MPAYKAGGPIQSIAALIENFNEGISYKIFCGDTDLDGSVLSVKRDEWLLFNNYTRVWYASKNDLSKTLTDEIESIKPGVLFIIGIFSWHYNIVPLLFGKANKKILSVRGMLHPGALTQKKYKKRLFLNAIKLTGIHKKITFHATNADEAQYIKNEFGGDVNICVAGNFGRVIRRGEPLYKKEGALQLITIALISPMKNHLAVLKALEKCTGNIEYNIYGPVKDMAYWQLCLQQINQLPGNIKVLYHGEVVPDEIPQLLAHNHVFIMPSKSENFGHAIFEALSAGLPVITSHATPWNDLIANKAGMNVSPEESELRDAIEFFAAMTNENYSEFSKNASAYILQRTDKENLRKQYTNMFSGN